MDDSHDSQWLTTPEVAELLRVSVRTVHDWRQSRTGPPGYRVGRRLLWKQHEVDLLGPSADGLIGCCSRRSGVNAADRPEVRVDLLREESG
jgi:excisionase family DNA binding protein